jgi:hypothetical protein
MQQDSILGNLEESGVLKNDAGKYSFENSICLATE